MKQIKQTLKRYSLVNFKIFLLLLTVSFGNGIYAQNGDSLQVPGIIDPCTYGGLNISEIPDNTVSGSHYHGKITGAATGGSTTITWKVQGGQLYYNSNLYPAYVPANFTSTLNNGNHYVKPNEVRFLYEDEDRDGTSEKFNSKDVIVEWSSAVRNGREIGYITMIIDNSGLLGACGPRTQTYIVKYNGESECTVRPVSASTLPNKGVICGEQAVYNCNAGGVYQFKTILGSIYFPADKDRNWKYQWFKTYLNSSTWEGNPFYTEDMPKGDQYYGSDLLRPYLKFTKTSALSDVYYITRHTQEDYCKSLFNCGYHDKEFSNQVKLALYSFNDPKLQKIKIGGDNTLSCDKISNGDYSANFYLVDPNLISVSNPTGQIPNTSTANVSLYGISNIKWVIPSTWQGWNLSGAWVNSIQPNVYVYDGNTNIPKGGQVYAIITYLDGQIITTAPLTVNPPVSITSTVSATVSTPGTITPSIPLLIKGLCATGTATFSANVTSTNPYFASWSVDGQPSLSADGLNYSLSGQTLGSISNVMLTISDNTNSCRVSSKVATVQLTDPGQGWAAYNFYASYPNMTPVDGANIVTDQIGLPYFAAGRNPNDGTLPGGIWVWKYIGNAWANQRIATNDNVDGEIALYQPTASAEPVIYYSALNQTKTQRSIFKIVRTAGVWGNPVSIYTFANTNPVTLRSAPNGDLYFRQDNNISKLTATNGQVNGGVAIPFTGGVYGGSKFGVTTNYVYYIDGTKKFSIKETGLRSGSVAGTPLVIPNTKFASDNTDVQVDDKGNGYFVDNTNTIRQFYVNKYTEDPILTYGYLYAATGIGFPGCNGKFGVNYTSGVVYATGTDLNIYQLYNNGIENWVNQNISPIAYSSGYISSQAAFKPKGSVVFAYPNAFYISTDGADATKNGNIKLITFSTNGTCKPARTRLDDSNENNDFVSRPVVGLLSADNSLTVFPNPLENAGVITYTLVADTDVNITLLNSMGAIEKVLLEEAQTTGVHNIDFSTRNLSKGLYFVRMQAGNNDYTTKVIVK